MKNREQKATAISEFSEGIGSAQNAFVLDFKGITVPQVTELRKQVRESGSEYVVIKNTLALIAVKDSPLQKLTGTFSGMTAIAYNTTDPVALAKVLTKFAKDVPTVQFKGALLAGQVVAANTIRNIAVVLDQIAKQKGGGEASTEEASTEAGDAVEATA
jgi:large subunit ribosomal protein L10